MELVAVRVLDLAKLLAAAGLTAAGVLGLVVVSLVAREFALTFLLIQVLGWGLVQAWDWALGKELALELVLDSESESPLAWGLAPE